MQAMETLVDRGQVRYIGVSNFSLPELRAAQEVMTKYPIVANQVLYNLNRREIERDLLPYCQEHNITILAYTPLDDGRLAAASRFRRNQSMRVLQEVATEAHQTLAQVALNWCTAHPNVIAIPKSNGVERTVENCQASGWRLTTAQLQRLDEAFT
jgi:diketogulonate reductase-like aldo/keto reductase